MSRVLLFVACFVPILTVEVGAQSASVPLSESAFKKTQDAVEIRNFCEASGADELFGLAVDPSSSALGAAKGSACADPTVARVVRFVRDRRDPPTREELDEAIEALRQPLESAGVLGGPIRGGETESAAGVLSFPTVALAVADFLLERAKAELVQSAFVDLSKQLEKGDLAILLPSTAQIVSNAENISYRSLLPTFRAAVREDLRSLPVNAVDTLSFYPEVCEKAASPPGRPTLVSASDDSCKEATTWRQVPDGLRLTGAAVQALLRLDEGEDPFLILSEIYDPEARWRDERIGRVVGVTARVALEARAYQAFAGPNAGSVNTGLPEFLGRSTEGPVFLAFLVNDLELPVSFSARFGGDRAKLDEMIRAVAGLAEAFATDDPFGGEPADPEEIRERVVAATVDILRTAVPLFTDAARARQLRRDLTAVLDLWRAAEARDYPRLVVLLSDGVARNLRQEGMDSRGVPMRILSFASSMAAAEDGEDVEVALEGLADPVGSFRSRRLGGEVQLAVVSYLGASWGKEWLDGQGTERVDYAGAFAPIGFELSVGTGWQVPASFGLNLSLVDLGTLVSYRLESSSEDDSQEEASVNEGPDVNIEHVFSPSIRLVIGITDSYPFSLSVGWQRAPELRSLEGSGDRISADRFVVSGGLDLTLFSF